MNTSFVNFVESEVDATHTHIARLMKRMYEHSYCASVDSRKVEWYEFTGCYWKKLPQGIELRNKMTSDVADVIIEARRTIRDRLIQANMDHAFVESRMKKMIKIEQSLYQSGFKDAVMKDCVGIFYEEDFALKLNANPYLIGFTNGVLDLHAVRKKAASSAAEGANEFYVQFRKAEPSDFVTFLAGRYATKNCDPIEYIEYDPRDPEQARTYREIDDFMEKVFPRAELRQYMWRKLASCLEGSNKEQTYDTWIGVGGNGKSKLVDLMSMVLGDYASSLQSTAMTRKRPDSGAANPDIMAIRNKRFIYMAEPDDREPLNTSRMKQFTGEDDVEARGLFEDVFALLPLSPSLWILRRRRSSPRRTSTPATMSWMRNCSGGGRYLCHAWFTSTARSICITDSERSPRLSHRNPTSIRSRLIPWRSSFMPVFVKSRWEVTQQSWPICGCPTDRGSEKMRGRVGN